MGYVSVSDNSIMEASLTISSAANRVHLNRSSVAGVDLFANNCDYCSDSDIPPVNRLCVPSDLSDKSNCVSLSSSSSSSSSLSSSIPTILRGPFMSDPQDCVLSKVLKSVLIFIRVYIISILVISDFFAVLCFIFILCFYVIPQIIN